MTLYTRQPSESRTDHLEVHPALKDLNEIADVTVPGSPNTGAGHLRLDDLEVTRLGQTAVAVALTSAASICAEPGRKDARAAAPRMDLARPAVSDYQLGPYRGDLDRTPAFDATTFCDQRPDRLRTAADVTP